MTPHEHKTWVGRHTDNYGLGRYLAECQICGPIGRPEDLEGDAVAIAARHQDIGGFER